MKIKAIFVVGVGLGFLSVIFVRCCFAMGLDNTIVGTKGIIMAHSIEGMVDDASAVYYNPAGLALMDRDTWQGDVYGYIAEFKCEYKANNITDKSSVPVYIPGFFISKTFDDWGFGAGFYVPFAGGGTSYDNFQNTPYDLETYAGWYCFTLATGYKLRPDLAVGVGVSLYGGLLEMEGFDPTLQTVVKNEYDGYSGYGGHIGLMYKPTEAFSIGVVARSPVHMEMDGSVKMAGLKIDSEAELTIPASYAVGLGYKPHTDLTITLSFWYRLYSDMTDLTFKILDTENKMKTYFKDTLLTQVGAEYQMSDKFTIRAGVFYDPSATEKKGLNAPFCDVDIWAPGIGVGYNINESTELNFLTRLLFGFDEEYNSQKFDKSATLFVVGLRFKC